MTVVTSSKKPVVSMEFQRKSVGITSIGAPTVVKTQIQNNPKVDTAKKSDLEKTEYFNQIGKTIVTNAKQALDTIVEKIPTVENTKRSLVLDPKGSEEFVARLVAPRKESNVFNIRLLESSDKSILIEEKTDSVDIRSGQNSLKKLEDVQVVEAKTGDTLVYDESKNSWVNHPLTRLEALKAKLENLVKEKEYSLEDAVDVRVTGFATKGQVLGYNDADGTWENVDVKQVEEVKLNEGVLELINSDDTIHRVDLKRNLELGDAKDVIIEAPKRGQKLAFDGHVWRNVYEEYGIDTSKLMSFVSFPSQNEGGDALELGGSKTNKKCSKVSVASGVTVGSKFNKKDVLDNHLVVSEAVGIGVHNPDKALVINSGVNGESGLKFTKLKAKKLEGETIGVNTKGEVVLIKNVSKFSDQIKPKKGEMVVNHNLNLADAMAINICCMSEEGEVLKTKIMEATSNTVKLKVEEKGEVRVTIIG